MPNIVSTVQEDTVTISGGADTEHDTGVEKLLDFDFRFAGGLPNIDFLGEMLHLTGYPRMMYTYLMYLFEILS